MKSSLFRSSYEFPSMPYSSNSEFQALTDFREPATLWVSLLGFLAITPFTLYNFTLQRYELSGLSFCLLMLLLFLAWNAWHGRHYPDLSLAIILPVAGLFLTIALKQQGIIGVLWCYPAILAFYVMFPQYHAWIANSAMLAWVLFKTWQLMDPSLAARVTATLISVSAFSAIFIHIIESQQRRMENMLTIDPLTGLSNRLKFKQTLESAIKLFVLNSTPMTLLSLDLDNFKVVNDTYGHESGDKVLIETADIIRLHTRLSDTAFRIGGEEFLILLHGADAENGKSIADKLCAAIAEHRYIEDHKVTTSIGVATLKKADTVASWTKRSDDYLYQAKNKGRNQSIALDY